MSWLFNVENIVMNVPSDYKMYTDLECSFLLVLLIISH